LIDLNKEGKDLFDSTKNLIYNITDVDSICSEVNTDFVKSNQFFEQTI